MGAFDRFFSLFGAGTKVFTDSQVLIHFLNQGNSLDVPIITPNIAHTINAVQACISLITETQSLVRPKIIEYTTAGKELRPQHDQYILLNRSANEDCSSIEWEKEWVANYLTHGNGYSEIIRNEASRPIAYVNLNPDRVGVVMDGKKRAYILKNENGQIERVIPSANMLHLADLRYGSLVAPSRIELHAGVLNDSAIVNSYSTSMYKNGVSMSGYIYGEKQISADAAGLLRDQFTSKWKNGETGVLPHGFKYEQLKYNLPMGDAQIIEAKKYAVEEISRIYRCPLSLLNRSVVADNKGESEYNQFLATVIASLCLLMQAELNRKIFKTNETTYSVVYELKGLERTSIEKRYDAHRIAIMGGFMSPDEVRDVEGMSPQENGMGRNPWRHLNMIDAAQWVQYFKDNPGKVGTTTKE